MNNLRLRQLAPAFLVLLISTLAACGGGGGGSGSPASNGGAIPAPGGGGSAPTPTPGPTATPGASGAMSIGSQLLANAKVVFTCGCSAQAGSTTTDASGNFSLPTSSTAVPAAPNPTYTTVPGRNYMIIGQSPSTSTQAWTMTFLGATPAHNIALNTNTDAVTTATALYVFFFSQNNSDQSFDAWNFNSIMAWSQSMRSSGGNNAAEKKLMADITSAQQAGTTLFPSIPGWDTAAQAGTNATITADLNAVKSSGDAALPTPCPNLPCSGAPSP